MKWKYLVKHFNRRRYILISFLNLTFNSNHDEMIEPIILQQALPCIQLNIPLNFGQINCQSNNKSFLWLIRMNKTRIAMFNWCQGKAIWRFDNNNLEVVYVIKHCINLALNCIFLWPLDQSIAKRILGRFILT